MPQPPRRPRFQIHLSTLIVLSFTAGFLLWANLRERPDDLIAASSTPHMRITSLGKLSDDAFIALKKKGSSFGYKDIQLGWPCDAMSYRWEIDVLKTNQTYFKGKFDEELSGHSVFINAFTALLILTATWFLCEFLIRRRSARKKG